MIEVRFEPVPYPTLADAEVDLALRAEEESAAVVYFGAVIFEFTRAAPGEPWTGGAASTRLAGYPIDEAYLKAARSQAVEALRRELALRGEGADEPDTVRCTGCKRIIASFEIRKAGSPVALVECGPVHAVVFRDGKALDVAPDGSATWRGEAP